MFGIKTKITSSINRLKVKNKPKYFCIGRNKTGTTSLKKAFKLLTFVVGNQSAAEKLLPYYKAANFDPIIMYCNTAEAFQDIPFSFPETYKHLNKAFSNSKFILTVRDSPEQWYNSVTKYHGKLFGNGNIPTKQDLQNAGYAWKGFLWECNRTLYKSPETDPYNKEILIKHYNDYNQSVINYFSDKPDKLLILNLSEKDAYSKFCKFIDIDSPYDDFPWENKTSNIKSQNT